VLTFLASLHLGKGTKSMGASTSQQTVSSSSRWDCPERKPKASDGGQGGNCYSSHSQNFIFCRSEDFSLNTEKAS